MAPASPWTNKKKKPAEENSFPGLAPTGLNNPKSQYEEIQEDELLALAAIYGEDFQTIETKGGAWKVK
jgi:translation initiation factor 2-alpha kinase 4